MFLPPALRKAKNLPQAGAVDAEVHAQARARLLSAIPEAVFESAPSSTAYTVGFLQSLIYKPVAVTAASLVFVAGGWVTTSAAQYSLPGDTLYNVKIIAERAQIRMASPVNGDQLGPLLVRSHHLAMLVIAKIHLRPGSAARGKSKMSHTPSDDLSNKGGFAYMKLETVPSN